MVVGQSERDRLLTADDAALLAECRVDRHRGAGRGGRKQDTTDSAIRLTHLSTRLSAVCSATRSQATNRTLALRRLRREIACRCRCAPPTAWTGRWCPGRREPDYPAWMAVVLDVLEIKEYRVRDAARFFGIGTGRFVRDIASDAQLWQQVNRGRCTHGLPPLRRA